MQPQGSKELKAGIKKAEKSNFSITNHNNIPYKTIGLNMELGIQWRKDYPYETQ